MDQVKIGKFIAECRKKEHLTQMQLAEKLNITDRAISKWETGVSVSRSILGRLRIPTDNLLASSFVPGSPSAFGRGILPQFSLHLSWCSVKIISAISEG